MLKESSMNRYVVDTNFLVALVDENDVWHEQSVKLLAWLDGKALEEVFFDCVMNESVSIIGRRLEEKGQSNRFPELLEKLEALVPENRIVWTYEVVPRLYKEILQIIRSHEGRLNFHDVLIILIMRESNMPYIVSFDRDFDGVEGIIRIWQEIEVKEETKS